MYKNSSHGKMNAYIVQVLNIILMYSKPEVCNYRFTLILHVKWTLRIICIRWMCFSFIILWQGIQIERVGLSYKSIIIQYYYRYIFLYVNFNNKVWIITYECLRSRIYLYLHILSSPNIRAHCINHHCDMQCIISQRGLSLILHAVKVGGGTVTEKALYICYHKSQWNPWPMMVWGW